MSRRCETPCCSVEGEKGWHSRASCTCCTCAGGRPHGLGFGVYGLGFRIWGLWFRHLSWRSSWWLCLLRRCCATCAFTTGHGLSQRPRPLSLRHPLVKEDCLCFSRAGMGVYQARASACYHPCQIGYRSFHHHIMCTQWDRVDPIVSGITELSLVGSGNCVVWPEGTIFGGIR